jgi:hypothetical protein
MSPVEASTGVTLPVIAKLNGLPSKHHAHFYGAIYKEGTLSQRALRFSRLQRLPPAIHKNFHMVFDGTTLPADEDEAYAATVLNCAGYIPRYGIRISYKDVSIEEIAPGDKKVLRKVRAFVLERQLKAQTEIGKFLMDYALMQEFSHAEQLRVEEFLDITPERMQQNEDLRGQKLRLGMRLANVALSTAIAPIADNYKQARSEKALRTGMPPSAWQFVKKLIDGHEIDYIPTLEARLKQEYGLLAA